ncbi:MBL fold metallo-hydrolase [bacterium]|nr:MBL fold metallo-hydrolase [bacterium]
MRLVLRAVVCAILLSSCVSEGSHQVGLSDTSSIDAISPGWCDELPRVQYASLERIDVDSDWFEVWGVGEDVFALYEPKQWQEKVSYLILGTERALLFDTGMGISSISEVVKQLTDLPIVVLNSDTHPDHTGGNADFSSILAMDTDFTRERAAGYPNERVKGELAPEALCGPLSSDMVEDEYSIHAWSASQEVTDGYVIDLGGRELEIIGIPGHTPDSIALFDSDAGYLWTGDSFYEGTIWLFFPETDRDSYSTSVERLASLVPKLTLVLPAHNAPTADPIRLLELRDAFTSIQEGTLEGVLSEDGTIEYDAGEFRLLLAEK